MSRTVFAIPSYQRPIKVKEATIPTLENLGVDKENIYVFVANEQEESLYRDSLGKEYNIVVGVLGIGPQRIFINDWFPEGTRIVSIDDDITKLVYKVDKKTDQFQGDLVGLVEELFNLCDSRGAKCWSITTTLNGFFMTNEIVVGLRQSLGGLFGEYSKLPEVQSDLPHCEDWEKFIKHYQVYGSMLRVNDLGAVQKYQDSGGVVSSMGGEEGRVKVYHEAVEKMVERYPDIVSRTKKETDYGRIRVKPITKERIESPVTEYANKPLRGE